MAAEQELERRLADGLHGWLDGETGPHPRWADAPARTRRPQVSRLARIPGPVRLLAVAALVAGAAGGALLLSGIQREPAGVGMCATIEDYRVGMAPSPEATVGPMPSVGPDATLSSGVLQPGQVALVGDASGPGAQARVSNPRICRRYPNLVPEREGALFAVVHIEVAELRAGYLGGWIPQSRFRLRRADDAFAWSRPVVAFNVPGVHIRTSLPSTEIIRRATDLVYEVAGGPATELFVEYSSSSEEGNSPATATWAIGSLPATPVDDLRGGWTYSIDPGLPATTGTVNLGETAIVREDGRYFGVRVGNVDTVDRYPAIEPQRGRFVEVSVRFGVDPDDQGPGPSGGRREWTAVDGEGRELTILANLTDAMIESLPQGMMEISSGSGWLVIDAPPSGEIRLQYRRLGEGPVRFEVLVRAAGG